MALKLLVGAASGPGDVFNATGSTRTIVCTADSYGTAKVQIEISRDGVVWVVDPDLVFTADTVWEVNIAAGLRVRGNIVDGTATNVDLTLQ